MGVAVHDAASPQLPERGADVVDDAERPVDPARRPAQHPGDPRQAGPAPRPAVRRAVRAAAFLTGKGEEKWLARASRGRKTEAAGLKVRRFCPPDIAPADQGAFVWIMPTVF